LDKLLKTAYFRFYEELNDFLPEPKRKKQFPYLFELSPSVKDAIEAIGVPHTEIDLILVNGVSVDFSYHILDNDLISVYPVFESLDITDITKLRPAPLREPKFILDVHLGKLARYMRLFGFDTVYDNKYDDIEIIERSIKEKRTILTRDILLLKNNDVTHGYWIRNTAPSKQIIEVIDRFSLLSLINPFQRCIVCNGIIEKAPKESVINELEKSVENYYDEFFRCTGCKKIYWKGSHYTKMCEFIEEIKKILIKD
jgi:uncharacterized protein